MPANAGNLLLERFFYDAINLACGVEAGGEAPNL